MKNFATSPSEVLGKSDGGTATIGEHAIEHWLRLIASENGI